MQDTCNYDECKLFDLLGGTVDQCPNFIESWWTPESDGKPILIKDCAPRRTFLMIQDLSNRLVGVQKASEQSRNNSAEVQVLQEALGRNIAGVLTQSLNAIAGELKLQLDTAITYIK